MKRALLLLLLLVVGGVAQAQWIPDQGDGTYRNPILYADYSDPDVIRVGDDYWMVASSFTCMPGIPLLHSKDLVNWQIVNHIYDRLPQDKYTHPVHGEGSWAPSIRYHKGVFYVYFCTPYDGLFVARTKNPLGKWELHQMVDVVKWEDPCPFWDEDGQAYLVHSIHRGGPAIMHRMSEDGLRLLDNGVTVYHNTKENPVLEGMKMTKRNGWYYIFAPAGGVSMGWQTVLRAKNIYGPYEARRVLQAGDNGINGPHQGGLVETQTGEWWFIHFQSKGIYGRVCHLQPACWGADDWIVIGEDPDGDGVGTPLLGGRKPDVGKSYPIAIPQTSDEFAAKKLGRQWQWHAYEQSAWYSLRARKGWMRLYAASCPSEEGNLHFAGNLLLQKIAEPTPMVTTCLESHFTVEGERAGLVMHGNPYTFIALERCEEGNRVRLYSGKSDKYPNRPQVEAEQCVASDRIWLRLYLDEDAYCRFAYSLDGEHFQAIGGRYAVAPGVWIGAKVGIFCLSPNVVSSSAYADFDFVQIERQQ
ncbi:MAG: glycoside hydrolase 43 family protein [Alistipes sp.]|nr:glycoside hydrolase 43 family protein [Alistipes sp.]